MVYLMVQNPERAGYIVRLGWGDMVYCFFSTVSYHLEGVGHWGERFPRLLRDLCDHGIVENEHLQELQRELDQIPRELQKYPVSEAIYDIQNLSLPIPWEEIPKEPGEEDINLAQPWVTPRGDSGYFTVFREQIQQAINEESPLLLIFPFEMGTKATLWQPKEKGHDYWTRDKDPISLSPDSGK